VAISPCHQCAIDQGALMAALKTERQVFLWRLHPRPIPQEATKPVTLEEILKILEDEFAAKRARVFLSADGRIISDDDPDRDQRHQVYIAEMKRDAKAGVATMLINRGDPNAVAPAFIDSDTSIVRVEHPKAKESPGWSAHLVVDLKGKDGAHKACFERMQKVSSSLVMTALDNIIARAAAKSGNYFYLHTIKKGTKESKESRVYRPYLSLKRVPSERLEDDLKLGTLGSITLTKKKSFYQGPGAANMVVKQEERIKITTKKVDDLGIVSNFVSDIIKRGKEEGYESVSFHVEGLPGGQTKDATMSLDEADAMEVLYVRAHRLTDFATVLEGCYSSVCSEIEARMLGLLKDKAAWKEV
jgi:hypothetical protein